MLGFFSIKVFFNFTVRFLREKIFFFIKIENFDNLFLNIPITHSIESQTLLESKLIFSENIKFRNLLSSPKDLKWGVVV